MRLARTTILIFLSLLITISITSAIPEDRYSNVVENVPETGISPDEECLVPCDDIVSGGPGKDGIPSLDFPDFVTASEADERLTDDEIVIGLYINGVAKAYPYNILNWHEIANDAFGDQKVSITYCPLTGSGILYKLENLDDTTLGVSGKLYENNLIMYDRNTDSYYSQMIGSGIMGENLGLNLERGVTVETTYGAWKAMYPDTLVLSRSTGFTRNYDRYPYGGYYTDNSIYFPSSFRSDPSPIADFYETKTLTLVLDILDTTNLISFNELVLDPAFEIDGAAIFFDQGARTALAFDNILSDGTVLTFSADEKFDKDGFGLQTFTDLNTGSTWNILGEAIDGNLEGTKLAQLVSYNAFWFATVAFFPNATVYFVSDDPYTPPAVESSSTDETPIFLPALPIIITMIIIFRRSSRR